MCAEIRLLITLWSALTLVACGGGTGQSSPSTPAVTVTAPVTEASLTTVTLTPEAEKRLGVQTALIERKALRRTRTVGGEVVAPSGAENTLTAPFAGRIEAPGGIPQVGTNVASGQTLFRLVPLTPSERDARVDAERAVGEAAARQEVAAKRLQRTELLARDGSGSKRAVEEAQGDLSIANADLRAARDRLALAERGTAPTGGIALDAPFPAILRGVHVSPGQTVASAAPLLDLVRLDTVWIRVPLYVGESEDVDTRAPARVVGLGEAADAEGVLARPVPAPPTADPSTAAVDLYFALANRGAAFRPGQRVGVRLTRRGEVESLVAPLGALLHDAFGGTWVYEAREPRIYVRRRVSVVDLADGLAVLDQGPAPGTRVVTEGAAELFGSEFGAGK